MGVSFMNMLFTLISVGFVVGSLGTENSEGLVKQLSTLVIQQALDDFGQVTRDCLGNNWVSVNTTTLVSFPTADININEAVDQILQSVYEIIVEEGLISIKLPDYYKEISVKALFIWVHGYVEVKEGYAYLGSPIRTGDSTADFEGDELIITTRLGLSLINVIYRNTEIKVVFYGSGLININCSPSIYVKIRLTLNSSYCNMKVDSAYLETLGSGGCSVTASGNFMMAKLQAQVSDILKNPPSNIKTAINNAINSALTKSIKTINICQYFLPLLYSNHMVK